MTINSLKDIIQQCHQRHEKPLRQRKTIVTPAVYKGLYHHFTVYCAHRHPVRLYDLEQADISFMPTGRTSEYDRVPQSFGGERFLKCQRTTDWEIRQWHTSWGIQVYTGMPSERNGARWHDLEFKYEAICAAPDAVFACIEMLVNVVANPLLTLTKSGGLRFSCRVPHYLHPNTTEAKFYIYKHIPTPEAPYQREVYLEILGEAGHSTWDARYEILLGNLLDPPIIAKEVLFAAIDVLRAELHEPEPLGTAERQSSSQAVIASPPSLGSHKLDLAKEAFLRRGFAYLREENDRLHWTQHTSEAGETDVLLWERNGIVWVRASASYAGLLTEDTPITEVWEDTGILPLIPATGLAVSETELEIREGELSPLAIKRSSPVLKKPEDIEKVYEPLEKSIGQIQGVFERETRVVGLIGETGVRNNYELESYILKDRAVSFNTNYSIINEAVEHFQRQNLPSLARWRARRHFWEKAKETPIDVRMATPFQHGNVCEDPERCDALEEKGGDPRKDICPKCPVYTECQQHGYLSQPATFQRVKTQILGFYQLFLDPQYSTVVEELLEPINDIERLCIIDEVRTDALFLECSISKNRLEAWCVNWHGSALGTFAQTLLSALEIESDADDIITKRIRTVLQAFQRYESELVRQMCQINVRCQVVERGIVDSETGEALARFSIAFEGGASAYIPLNNVATDRLTAKGLPVFQLESFVLNVDMKIPMSIEQAIQFGILDVGTVEKIKEFPAATYRNPDWTFWHQLKRFFAHYTRDTDAPMIWHDNILQFWVPPVLNPSIQRLLYMSATLSEQDLRRAFPNENIEVTRINSTPWVDGNQFFQIRSGVHTLKTVVDHDSTWDVTGLSKMGERILLGICAEIARESSIKHAIITYDPIIEQLKEVAEKENVCLLTESKDLSNLETAFEEAQVIWIVGTPYWEPGVIWRQAQILFGSDEEPLCYEADETFQHYKDERIQKIYTQIVAELTTNTIGRAGLNRWSGKKVVLISNLEIPDITDRPETFLFDWEDFEIAGGLDKLAETIAIRERFEAERENLTAESSRVEVERVLGCSSRQANRVLNKLRGGNIPHVTFREQILSLLAEGEKKAAEVIAAIEGNPKAIHHELVRLVKIGEIVKVRWGVYALPEASSSEQ